jgi:hypothetical protein
MKDMDWQRFMHPVVRKEYDSLENPLSPNDALELMIYADRECPKWKMYHPGLSPGEHLVELRIENMHTDSMRIADENAALAKSGHELANEMRFLTWVIVALTFATVLIAIITNSPAQQPQPADTTTASPSLD